MSKIFFKTCHFRWGNFPGFADLYIPHFDDLSVLKAENVNDCFPELFLILLYMGVEHNPISFCHNLFHVKDFIRVIRSILFHRLPQRFGISSKKCVMMAETFTNIFLKCTAYISLCRQLQKLYCFLF